MCVPRAHVLYNYPNLCWSLQMHMWVVVTAICCKIFAINNICNFHEWSTVANISSANIYVLGTTDVIIIICTMMT